jgi:hypothetical protein
LCGVRAVTGGPQGSAPGKRDRLGASADLVREREVRELAGLLAKVVELASSTAMFPGRWEQVAEDAMEHASVRAALAGAERGAW